MLPFFVSFGRYQRWTSPRRSVIYASKLPSSSLPQEKKLFSKELVPFLSFGIAKICNFFVTANFFSFLCDFLPHMPCRTKPEVLSRGICALNEQQDTRGSVEGIFCNALISFLNRLRNTSTFSSKDKCRFMTGCVTEISGM